MPDLNVTTLPDELLWKIARVHDEGPQRTRWRKVSGFVLALAGYDGNFATQVVASFFPDEVDSRSGFETWPIQCRDFLANLGVHPYCINCTAKTESVCPFDSAPLCRSCTLDMLDECLSLGGPCTIQPLLSECVLRLLRI